MASSVSESILGAELFKKIQNGGFNMAIEVYKY